MPVAIKKQASVLSANELYWVKALQSEGQQHHIYQLLFVIISHFFRF